MKKIIGEFFGHFFSNPVLPLLVVVCSVAAMFLTSDSHAEKSKLERIEAVKTVQAVRLSTIYSTAATTSTTTTTTVTTETETTVTAAESAVTGAEVTIAPGGSNVPVPKAPQSDTSTETAPAQQQAEAPAQRLPLSDYTVYSGADSPNSAYYQERLTILGDSIAYGFNAYGYIPAEHNIAKESMALWNISKYTFDLGGGAMGAVDAAVYSDSPLIYISIGMNDIFAYSADDYASRIYAMAQQLVDSIPDTTVVIGSITPVSANNYYTTNSTIDSFNYALETTVNSYASPQILYFNANSVLKDPNTGALSSSVSGGDGLHISGAAYGSLLNALFNYLDTTDTLTRIETHDSKYQ